ncbi:MAG TPA: NmrA/HSCARG family protein [Longimicrobiaceae bacterium]|nr:NmrA/HSCARG family protein [Longimicrobiaceae bacterium]
MGTKRTIVVLGATGAQGGGVAGAILADPNGAFEVRAVTRNPDSPKAQELARLGAEVVRADLDDVESLKRAFDGAYGMFGLTNFWEHFSPEKETTQGRNLAEAAADAGIEHAIWSTFEDTRDWIPLDDDRMPTLQGRYKVPHFDAKAEADGEFTKRGVPTTFLRTSFYWENAINFGTGPKRGEDGVLAITMPMGDKRLPGIAVEDIGAAAYGIFKAGDEYIGRKVGIAGEHLTGDEMAAGFGRALGEQVRYNDVPPDVYRGFGFPGADDMGNMFQFKRDFNEDYCGARDLAETRRLNPALKTFDQWLDRNRARIPVD